MPWSILYIHLCSSSKLAIRKGWVTKNGYCPPLIFYATLPAFPFSYRSLQKIRSLLNFWTLWVHYWWRMWYCLQLYSNSNYLFVDIKPPCRIGVSKNPYFFLLYPDVLINKMWHAIVDTCISNQNDIILNLLTSDNLLHYSPCLPFLVSESAKNPWPTLPYK